MKAKFFRVSFISELTERMATRASPTGGCLLPSFVSLCLGGESSLAIVFCLDGGLGETQSGVAMQILNILAPVFLMIGLGAILEATKFVSPTFLKEANRLTYWLGLPALLFSQLSASFHDVGGARVMLGTMFLATLLVILLGYGVAWILRIPGSSVGTFVQGGFRGNLAFVGLPIIFSFSDEPLPWGVSIRTAAILIVAPMMVFYNIAGVVVLLLSQHKLGWQMVKPFAKQLATTPPLLATIAGIAFALMGWPLPPAVDKTFTALGEMALPLGLLGVGGSLVTVQLRGNWRASAMAAFLKTFAAPALSWVLGRHFGLAAAELKVLLILLACPTAIVSYTMVVELKGDETLASGAIVFSVFASIVSLAVIVGVF